MPPKFITKMFNLNGTLDNLTRQIRKRIFIIGIVVFYHFFHHSFQIINQIIVQDYSYLSASTGFLVAAFQLCQLTVSRAIPNASKPAKAKIHQLSGVL